MAQISRFLWLRHLRAEPNQFVLHYQDGQVRRRGPGLNYWFSSYSAAIAQLPVEDCETTFVLKERSADYQEISVQLTLVYRIGDPERAAQRVNFSISIDQGQWLEPPLEKLSSVWSLRAQPSVRAYLMTVPVVVAIREGAEKMRTALLEALNGDPELAAMGLSVVRVAIDRVAPTAEVEKALQTPTRESIQEKADEAVFSRRALAVEKERAIKQNELSTQIELARRGEELIRQNAANQKLEVESEVAANKRRTEAEIEQKALLAAGYAEETRVRSTADAEAQKLTDTARAEGEDQRVGVWKEAPTKVVLGLALQELAHNIRNIEHLNLTPDLLSAAVQRYLSEEPEAS
ncbi:MAG: SPFH domain-containing protein [Myxococcota bacterium]